ncbi:MAG: hypothetical protein R2761_25945 [Acidimicrobiales bacterium]
MTRITSRLRSVRLSRFGGCIAAAGTAALLPDFAAAVAFISPPLVLLATPQPPAHLVARGAALDVTVEYSCTAQPNMFIEVRVTEAVGRRVASGFGSTSVGCDGATHRTVVRVVATPGGAAFARGTAVVDASVFGCRDDFAVCGNDTISRTVRVRP